MTGVPATADELVGRFLERAQRLGSTVHDVRGWDGAGTLVTGLAEGGPVVLTPPVAGLAAFVDALAGVDVTVTDDPATAVAHSLDAPLAVVRGELGVAESGSVVHAEPHLDTRAPSMLAQVVVQLVPANRVVASLDDVARWIAAETATCGYVSLVSGPSRTADIERSLTIGVQGPHTVHVVVVRGAEDAPHDTARATAAVRA